MLGTLRCFNSIGLKGMLCTALDLLNYVIPVLITLGVVYFVWGVVQYFIGDGEEAKKAGKNRIIFGIIGLAVIIAIWGLVNVLLNTFNLNNPNNIAPTGKINSLLPGLPQP